jgi:hypothetical protein
VPGRNVRRFNVPDRGELVLLTISDGVAEWNAIGGLRRGGSSPAGWVGCE